MLALGRHSSDRGVRSRSGSDRPHPRSKDLRVACEENPGPPVLGKANKGRNDATGRESDLNPAFAPEKLFPAAAARSRIAPRFHEKGSRCTIPQVRRRRM